MINMISDQFNVIKSQEVQNKYDSKCDLNFEYEMIKLNNMDDKEIENRGFNFIVLFTQNETEKVFGRA